MIPIFDSDGNRLPITYNGYSLNVMSNIETTPVGTKVTAVAPSNAIDYISDKLQWRDGIELYGITKGSLVIVINGIVYGGSQAGVADRSLVLSAAFDPGRIAFYNDDPFLPMTFSVPTNGPSYPTGFQESKIFVLPLETPLTPVIEAQGFARRFRITLLAKDPRRYLQTPITHTIAGTTPISNSLAYYPSYPTVTFTMTGAGAANFRITNTATRQGSPFIVLDLSGRSNGQVITVDFANQRVLVNGTVTQGIYVSGDWWMIEPGSNDVFLTNPTNIATPRTLTVYPAFPA